MPVTQEAIDSIAATAKSIKEDTAKLYDKSQRELAELRSDLDTVAKKAQIDPVFVNKVDTIAASVETMAGVLEGDKAVIKALETRADALEAQAKRPGTRGGWGDTDEAKNAKDAFEWHKAKLIASGKLGVNTKIEPNEEEYKAYCEAFAPYMRSRSEAAMKPEYQAAMSTGSDPDGGYLVPKTVDSRIINKVYETSNLRALATVVSIGGKELEIPRDEGEFGYGGWVGETTAPTESATSQLGVSKIFAHEMFAEPRVTQNMLEDAGLDIEAWVANKVGDKMARIEATAFFTGTGVNQPRGLLTYANGTTNGTIEQIVSGGATTITSDAIYNLVFSLKDYYTAGSNFVMKRTTVRDVLKLKDGQNNYLWQMGDIKNGQPSTLLTYPVVRAEDMPTIAASSLSVAFGDFKQAYTIVERLGITLLRDNLTAKPYVKFYTRRRVGGDVVNFEAVKLLITSA